jgi:hypothetical protein
MHDVDAVEQIQHRSMAAAELRKRAARQGGRVDSQVDVRLEAA